MIDEKRLIKAIENSEIREQINSEPKAYKFLKTEREKMLFIDGYHYALRDFIILIEKIIVLNENKESGSGQ